MSDASGRQRRRTWVTGGILLVLSAVVSVIARGPLAGIAPAKDWLWAIGALVLVIGLGRAGSVTARKPFVTVVAILQILLANPLAAAFVSSFILADPASLQAEEDSWKSTVFPYLVVVFVLTVLTALLIGFARAVPRPWSWAPTWVLAWSWILGFLSLQMFSGAPVGTWVATGAVCLGWLSASLGTAFLGVVAIVLGLRATRATVTA